MTRNQLRDMCEVVIILSDEASLDIYLAAQHLAARGMAVARIDKATRVLSGHCRRDALEKLCEVSGVARIEQRGKLPMSAGKSRGS
jgi:hypothetical protein